MTELTDPATELASLRELVLRLSARVDELERQVAQPSDGIEEDVLLVIAAACAAYLGKRATIKQVHLRRGSGWVSEGRAAVQLTHSTQSRPRSRLFGDRNAAGSSGVSPR